MPKKISVRPENTKNRVVGCGVSMQGGGIFRLRYIIPDKWSKPLSEIHPDYICGGTTGYNASYETVCLSCARKFGLIW